MSLTPAEETVAHNVIAKFFDLKVLDMGGGLLIVSPAPKNWTVEERDLIVHAVKQYIAPR